MAKTFVFLSYDEIYSDECRTPQKKQLCLQRIKARFGHYFQPCKVYTETDIFSSFYTWTGITLQSIV